jgi:hypothetical protein
MTGALPSRGMKIAFSVGVLALTIAAVAGCDGAEGPKVVSAGGTPTIAATSDVVGTYVDAIRVWVVCLRGEGIKVSDPDPRGEITYEGDIQRLKSDPKFIGAQQKCKGLYPPMPAELLQRPPLTPEQIKAEQEYAKCMQQNGAPDFPDPNADGYFPEPPNGQPGWRQDTEAAMKALKKCEPIVTGISSPGVSVG